MAGHAAAQAPALAQPKADSPAETAAAMERAQRLAANPMRVILEAGRIRRAGEPSAAPTDASQAPPTRSLAGTLATAPPAQQQGAAQTPLLVTANSLRDVTAAVPALQTSAEPTAAAVAFSPLPPTAAPQAALAASLVIPKLVSSVAPSFKGPLVDDAARLGEVTAELRLRADGSVGEVLVHGGMPQVLKRPIISALEQWRFEPLPAARSHRVQLVFGGAEK